MQKVITQRCDIIYVVQDMYYLSLVLLPRIGLLAKLKIVVQYNRFLIIDLINLLAGMNYFRQ